MKLSTAMKLIIKSEFANEMNKRRDMTERGTPVFGEISNATKATLLIVEDEIEKKVKRLIIGESVKSILPHLKSEEEFDAEDIEAGLINLAPDEEGDYNL